MNRTELQENMDGTQAESAALATNAPVEPEKPKRGCKPRVKQELPQEPVQQEVVQEGAVQEAMPESTTEKTKKAPVKRARKKPQAKADDVVQEQPALDVEAQASTAIKTEIKTKASAKNAGDVGNLEKAELPEVVIDMAWPQDDYSLEAVTAGSFVVGPEIELPAGQVSEFHDAKEASNEVTTDGEAKNSRHSTERRGRGLRAIVSRTRRKNVRNRPVADKSTPALASAPAVSPSPRLDGNISFDDVISGRFDDCATSTQVKPVGKRVLQPQPESPKLHKVLAQAGGGSRLDMEQLILEGRISVNGEPAHIGQRIRFGDQVRVNGKTIRVQIAPPAARVLAYHKSAGEIVTRDDLQSRPTVFRRLPKLALGKWLSIGRLDLNTEGLLLFTNSGELANALMHPRFNVEREYAVRVLGGLSDEEKKQLLDGIELEDGRAHFKSIENGGGEGANQWYRVVICEGRNREVRRMIESLGHAVSRLIRIRYGAVVLPANLRQGQWAELSENELKALGKLVGGKAMGAIQGAEPANYKNKGGLNKRGKAMPGNNAMGSRRNSNQNTRNNHLKNQPDPMKTSVGYIEHDRFISPSGLSSGRGRSNAGYGTGRGGYGKQQRNTRGGGGRSR